LANWTFAQKNYRLNLAIVGENQVVRYQYCYACPHDCLKIVEIYQDKQFQTQRNTNSFFNYEIFISYEGKKIINTDAKNAVIRYTADICDTQLYEPQFCEAFVNLLAYELCFCLSGNDQKGVELYQIYQLSLDSAKAVSANNKRDKIDYESEIIRSRNG
jgi:hypothetical protein